MKAPRTFFNDIETTGLPPKMAVPGKRIGTTRQEQIPYETGYMQYPYVVSIAWAVDDEEVKHRILNQEGRKIPQETIDIHGITDEMAAKSDVTFYDAIKEMIEDAEGSEVVVGHNIYFDTSIIKANVLRGIKEAVLSEDDYAKITEILHKDKRIDTCRRTIKMMGKWPTLQELHMKIFRKGFEPHKADQDVGALRRCYKWLLQKGIVPTHSELLEKAKERKDI